MNEENKKPETSKTEEEADKKLVEESESAKAEEELSDDELDKVAGGSGGLKGPFRKGSPLRATRLEAPEQQVLAEVLDDHGSFAFSVPWSGPTLLELTGVFVDEFFGTLTQLEQPLLALVEAEANRPLDCSINLLTTLTATLARRSPQLTAARLEEANRVVSKALFGVEGVNVSRLCLTRRSDPKAVEALHFQLALAATAGMSRSLEAVAQLAEELAQGRSLGSSNTVVKASELEAALERLRAGQDLFVKTSDGERVRVALADVYRRLHVGSEARRAQRQTQSASSTWATST